MKRRRDQSELTPSREEEKRKKRHKRNAFCSKPSIPSPEELSMILGTYGRGIVEIAKKKPPSRITIRSESATAEYKLEGKKKKVNCSIRFAEKKIIHAECSCSSDELEDEDVILVVEEESIPPLYCEHVIGLLMNILDTKEIELRDLTGIASKILSISNDSLPNSILKSVSLDNAKTFVAIQNRILSSDKENFSDNPGTPEKDSPQSTERVSPHAERDHYIPSDRIKSFLLKLLKISKSNVQGTSNYFPGCNLRCKCDCHNKQTPCGLCEPQTILIRDFTKLEGAVGNYIKLSRHFLKIGRPFGSYRIIELLIEVFFVHLKPTPYQVFESVNQGNNNNNDNRNEFEFDLSNETKQSIVGRKRIFDKLKEVMIQIGTLPSSEIPIQVMQMFKKKLLQIHKPAANILLMTNSNNNNNNNNNEIKTHRHRSYQEKVLEEVIGVFKYTNDSFPLSDILSSADDKTVVEVQGFSESREIGMWRICGLLGEKNVLMQNRVKRVSNYVAKMKSLGTMLDTSLKIMTDKEGEVLNQFGKKKWGGSDNIDLGEFLFVSLFCFLKVTLIDGEEKNRFYRNLIMMILRCEEDIFKVNEFLLSIVYKQKIEESQQQQMMMTDEEEEENEDENQEMKMNLNCNSEQIEILKKVLQFSLDCVEKLFLRNRNHERRNESGESSLIEFCKIIILFDSILDENGNLTKEEKESDRILKLMKVVVDHHIVSDCEELLNKYEIQNRMGGLMDRYVEYQSKYDLETDMGKKMELTMTLFTIELKKKNISLEQKEGKVKTIISSLFSLFHPSSIYILLKCWKIIEKSIPRLREVSQENGLIDEIIFRISSFVFCNLISEVVKNKRSIQEKHFIPFFRISKKVMSPTTQLLFTLLASQMFRPDYVRRIFPSLSGKVREDYISMRFLDQSLLVDFPRYIKNPDRKGSQKKRYCTPEQSFIRFISSSRIMRNLPNPQCCSFLCELCYDWINSLPSCNNLFSNSGGSLNISKFLDSEDIGPCQCTFCSYVKHLLRQPVTSKSRNLEVSLHTNAVCAGLTNHLQKTFPSSVLGKEIIESSMILGMFLLSRRIRKKNLNTFCSFSPRSEEKRIVFTKNLDFVKKKEAQRLKCLLSSFSKLEKKILINLLKSGKRTGSKNIIEKSMKIVLTNIRNKIHISNILFNNNRMRQQQQQQQQQDDDVVKKKVKLVIQKYLQTIMKFTIHCEDVSRKTRIEVINLSTQCMEVSYTRNILLSRLLEQIRLFDKAIEYQKELFFLHPNLSNFQQLELYQKNNVSFFTNERWERTKGNIFNRLNNEDNEIIRRCNDNLRNSGQLPDKETLATVQDRFDLYAYLKNDRLVENAFILCLNLYCPTTRIMSQIVLKKRDELVLELFQALRKAKVNDKMVNDNYELIKDHILGRVQFSSSQQEHEYQTGEDFFNLVTEMAKTKYRSIAFSLMHYNFMILKQRDFCAKVEKLKDAIGVTMLEFVSFFRRFRKIYGLCGYEPSRWRKDLNSWLADGLGSGERTKLKLPYNVSVYVTSSFGDLRQDYEKTEIDDLVEDVIVMGESEQVYECPIILDVLDDPVKNKVCGHVYSREGANLLIIEQNQSGGNRNSICPMPGCSAILERNNLVDDHETKRLVEMKKMLEDDDEDDDDVNSDDSDEGNQKKWETSSSDDDNELIMDDESEEGSEEEEEEEEEGDEKKRKKKQQKEEEEEDEEEDVVMMSNERNQNNNQQERERERIRRNYNIITNPNQDGGGGPRIERFNSGVSSFRNNISSTTSSNNLNNNNNNNSNNQNRNNNNMSSSNSSTTPTPRNRFRGAITGNTWSGRLLSRNISSRGRGGRGGGIVRGRGGRGRGFVRGRRGRPRPPRTQIQSSNNNTSNIEVIVISSDSE